MMERSVFTCLNDPEWLKAGAVVEAVFKRQMAQLDDPQPAPALLTCVFLLFRVVGRAFNSALEACTLIV